MRKIFSSIIASADGYYEGPNGEFDWPNVDDEFNNWSVEQLNEVDTLLFGRITYEGMAAHWPTPEAVRDDPEIGPLMNNTAKIVISRTLERAEWANTRLIKDNVAEELIALKRQPGKDLAIFGSSDLTVSLIKLGLVDEVRIMIHPIVLGAGNSVFKTADRRIGLRLVKARPFTSGNVLLYYQPA